MNAKRRRVQVLIAQGFAEREDGNRLRVRRDLLAALEQREVTRVGQELAEKRNTPFRPANDGERIYGKFKETVQLGTCLVTGDDFPQKPDLTYFAND